MPMHISSIKNYFVEDVKLNISTQFNENKHIFEQK